MSVVDGWGDESVVDGWGDDEELDVSLDVDSNPEDEKAAGDDDENAWDDDDLNFNDEDAGFNDELDSSQPTVNVGESTLLLPSGSSDHGINDTTVEKTLKAYIYDLGNGTLLNKTNQILGSSLNCREEALELCRYYHDRPQLRDYTLNTEVPRMDYQVMISDEVVLTETVEIQKHFSDYPIDDLVDDMLLRSSNQSLLADIFQIITGPDLIIRNQFLATAVATTCRFVIDMRRSNQPQRHLQADCQMIISVPSGESYQSKLNLSSLRLLIHFCPEPASPSIKYEIVSIRPLLNPLVQSDETQIRLAAETLEEHTFNDPSLSMKTSPSNANTRDNFIQSIMSTQSGFKSALKDIDNVINVSSKLNILKSVTAALPRLPTADDIMDASGVEDKVLPKKSNHDTNFRTHGKVQGQAHTETTESIISDVNAPLSRPKPIVGGLFLSGIERLAKAAALTDVSVLDVDNEAALRVPKFYRLDEETLPQPGEPNVQQEDFSLKRRDDFMPDRELPPPPAPPTKPISPKIAESPLVRNHDKQTDSDENQKSLQVKENTHTQFNDQAERSQDDDEGWSDDDILSNAQTLDTQDISNLTPTKERGRKSDDASLDINPPSFTKTDPLLQQVLRDISNCSVDTNMHVPNDFIYETDGIIPTRKRFISRSERLQTKIKDIS